MNKRDVAVIVGGTGGIGRALVAEVERSGRFDQVFGLGRGTTPSVDLLDDASIGQALAAIADKGRIALVINAAGFLHGHGFLPEKATRQLDPTHMAHAFAVNTIGPAMVLKHAMGLLPKTGKAILATLSARVGSIGNNKLGGWHSYRASKSALNQIVRTCAIELARTHPGAICVAIHPGTVDTPLSRPYARSGLAVQTPEQAAKAIAALVMRLQPEHSGAFLDRTGVELPW